MIEKNIVLLHGWGASVEKLKPLALELEKKGWDVLLPKLPGFDASVPKIVWNLKDYSGFVLKKANKYFGRDSSTSLRMTERQIPKRESNQSLDCRNDEDSKYFVFGHSFGGRVAIKMVAGESRQDSIVKRQAPLITSFQNDNISGIIFCAAGGLSRGNPVKRAIFFVLAKLGKIFLLFMPFAKVWKKFVYKIAREHDYEKTKGVMRDTFKNVINENLKPLIQFIKVPTLILWGEKDTMTPFADALFVKKILSKSKLVSFENDGHKLPYEKPKRLASEINKWFESMT